MSKPKARIHLDQLIERHSDDHDDDFDEPTGHLPAKSAAKGYTQSGSRDWDYDAKGGDRTWKEGGDVHAMVAANLPLAKTIASDFANIPGVKSDDIMSAAKEALYSAIELYTPGRGKFSSWLGFIVRQRLQQLYNTQRDFADHEVTSLDAPLSDDDDGGEDSMLDTRDNAGAVDLAYGREGEDGLRSAARSEAQEIVRRAIEKLDPLYRRIVTMHHSVEGGLSVRDIADQLKDEGIKLSSQSVWKYLNKGMAQVKDILAGAGFVDASDDGGLVHKEERPERPEPKEPDYVDNLLAKKAAKHKESNPTSESRQGRFGVLPAVYASPGCKNAATGLLEAADALLPDDTDTLDMQFAEQWDALVDEVTDQLMASQDAPATEDAPKRKTGTHSDKDGPKVKKESRRLTARDLTDRLLA